ncbi:L-lactate permease [Streptomyces sp. NPDC047000]|uniref:L-lactate permease n=1 Tax=Streptomyces sp. NPDC047000 TaxID=3155474 RepID=UPI0033E55A10
MYTQDFDPTGSLFLSALLALLPLLVLLVLLGGIRLKAHWAGLAGLLVALGVAVLGYSMPVGQALDSAAFGAAFSVLAILWITFNAIWIYNLTVETGDFHTLRRAFASVSDDRRIQAIVIAFAFGALLEALAGGGSPIAICAVMLIALGFSPLKAAALTLVADTAPVAFGGMGNPITIIGATTGLDADRFGAMAGRQTPLLAALVPFVLLYMADGRRGLRQVWPAALAAGLSFSFSQFVFSNYFAYKLTDIFAALVSVGAILLLNRFWKPEPADETDGAGDGAPAGSGIRDDDPHRHEGTADSTADRIRAFAPYGIIVLLFSLAQIEAVKDWLAKGTCTFAWPGLHILNSDGDPMATNYVLNWASHTGTLLFISGLLTMLVLKTGPTTGMRVYGRTIRQFGWAIFTILCVFSLSYVMNQSGQIVTLGQWLAGSGGFFAFLSPVVGWFGVAITGTDAGANALFGGLQVTAAHQLDVSPYLFGAANSTGGVMAKMISPQSLAVGAAAVGIVGQEGTLFRRVFGWSMLLLLITAVLVYLQSTPVLDWMVV